MARRTYVVHSRTASKPGAALRHSSCTKPLSRNLPPTLFHIEDPMWVIYTNINLFFYELRVKK